MHTDRFAIDPRTTIGSVTLPARDIGKVAQFYEDVIGLTVLKRSERTVELGCHDTPLVILESRPHGKQSPRSTGLFHLAILLPTRKDLGHWLRHLSDAQYPMDGAGDHLVSEALYLSDPEGNGIEIYCDRPRESWQYVGNQIKMDTLPVDLEALQAEAPADRFVGLTPETTIGHIHLRVDDVAKAIEFYRDVLGFNLMATWRGAAFLSAGGYHHHIGVNMWHSRGAPPPPPDSLGLVAYRIMLPTDEALRELLERLDTIGYPVNESDTEPFVRDPAGNGIVLQVKREG